MYNYNAISKEVEKLKKVYNTGDPFKICKQMGIKVLETPMGKKAESCKGFYLTHSRVQVITINSDLSAEFKRIICSHELGHAVLHKNQAGLKSFHDFGLFDSAATYEYEANIFAAELLLDDEEVIKKLNDDMFFFQAAAELYVPPEILEFKFRAMKRKGYKVDSPHFATSTTWLKKAKDSGTDF